MLFEANEDFLQNVKVFGGFIIIAALMRIWDTKPISGLIHSIESEWKIVQRIFFFFFAETYILLSRSQYFLEGIFYCDILV